MTNNNYHYRSRTRRALDKIKNSLTEKKEVNIETIDQVEIE